MRSMLGFLLNHPHFRIILYSCRPDKNQLNSFNFLTVSLIFTPKIPISEYFTRQMHKLPLSRKRKFHDGVSLPLP